MILGSFFVAQNSCYQGILHNLYWLCNKNLGNKEKISIAQQACNKGKPCSIYVISVLFDCAVESSLLTGVVCNIVWNHLVNLRQCEAL